MGLGDLVDNTGGRGTSEEVRANIEDSPFDLGPCFKCEGSLVPVVGMTVSGDLKFCTNRNCMNSVFNHCERQKNGHAKRICDQVDLDMVHKQVRAMAGLDKGPVPGDDYPREDIEYGCIEKTCPHCFGIGKAVTDRMWDCENCGKRFTMSFAEVNIR